MIELRVLGGLELAGDSSTAARLLLSQPRATALLIYLAMGRPSAFHRRDTLVQMFWPESDQDHARSNLRKLIFTIRRALGDQTIEPRGDEEVRLSEQVVWCDAVEFEDCIRKHRHSRAIELYRGMLLPGFHVGGAGEFDMWLDQKRRELGKDAIRAAVRLAEEHVRNREVTEVGNVVRFVRGLGAELDDEHLLRKIVGLLESIGDRATALGVYEEFRTRLENDHRAIPSRETRDLIERIRRS